MVKIPKVGDKILDIDEEQSIAINEIMLKMNPVGTIYTSTESTNPSTFIGGTWEEYGKGRVLVGLDSSQTEFNTVGKTGGENEVTLTKEQMPKHRHKMNMSKKPGVYGNPPYGDGGVDWVDSSNVISEEGGDKPHNNLQPYITVHRFRRIA